MKIIKAIKMAACLGVVLSSSAVASTLIDQPVSLKVYWPADTPDNLHGYGNATVGSGVEFENIGFAPFNLYDGVVANADVDVSADEITWTFKTDAQLAANGYNGYRFQLLSSSAPAILGVSLDTNDSLSIDPSNITFTDNLIDINVAGLTITDGGTLGLKVLLSDTQTVTPEPAAWALLAVGLGTVGCIRRRRTVKQ